MKRSNLGTRLIVAAIGMPVVVSVAWAGGPIFAAALGLLAGIGFREYAEIILGTPSRTLRAIGTTSAFAFPFVVLYGGLEGAMLLFVILLLATPMMAVATVGIPQYPVRNAALVVFGVLWTGGLLAFAIPLREGWVLTSPAPDARYAGTLLVMFPIVLTWVADSAAYLGGRASGRRPLAALISPNKTVEGAVCGLVASTGAAGIYAEFVPGWTLGLPATLFFGLCIGSAAIKGDLVESALKREVGAKDTSTLLPGHGGMLDRLDSLLWTLPVSVLVLMAFRLVG